MIRIIPTFVMLISLWFLFSWCVINQNTIEEEVDSNGEVVQIETGEMQTEVWKENVGFDPSHIVVEDAEISFGWRTRYKDIKAFKKGTIGIEMGWQDGYSVRLIYTENNKIIAHSDDIFWYDMWYTNREIRQFCLQRCDASWCIQNKRAEDMGDLQKCILVKKIDACFVDHAIGNATDCTNKAMNYFYDLVQWTETNAYFQNFFEEFKNNL